MILELLYLLLLRTLCLGSRASQDFDAAIWSNPANPNNHFYDASSYNLFHQSEISQINNLAMLPGESNHNAVVNCGNKNHKHDMFNRRNGEEPDNSKEELYVFLDKGRARYMPLSERAKPIVSHSPMNVNGKDMHLSDMQVLKNVGLNHDVLSEHNERDPFNLQAQNTAGKQRNPKSQNVNKNPNIAGHNHQNQHRYSPNRYAPRQRYMNTNQFSSSHQPLRNPCKKSDYNAYKPKYSRDCQTKRRNKPSTYQSDYLSTQGQKPDVIENISETPRNRHNSQKSFTTIHKGVVKICSPDYPEKNFTSDNPIDVNFNNSAESSTSNGSNDSMDEAMRTDATPSDTSELTDSPIYYIKIKNPRRKSKIRKNQTKNKNGKFNISHSTESSKNFSNGVIETESNPLYDDDQSKSELISIDASTPESNDLIGVFSTENNESSSAKNLFVDITANAKDLARSEDRLYAYVAKPKKKSRKSKNKDKTEFKNTKINTNSYQNYVEHMEPIAYETYMMKPNKRSSSFEPAFVSGYESKAKRFTKFRVLDSGYPMPKIERRAVEQTSTSTSTSTTSTTTSTTTSQPFLMQPSPSFEGSDAAENNGNEIFGKTFPEQTQNSPQDNFVNFPNDNIHAVGHTVFLDVPSSFSPSEPCTENEDYVLGSNGLGYLDSNGLGYLDNNGLGYRKPQHFSEDGLEIAEQPESYIFESDIHGILNDYGDTGDSVETKFDDDRNYEVADTVTPAAQNGLSELCT